MKHSKLLCSARASSGRVHLEGIRRLGYVELYAIGEPQIEKAKQLAAEFGVAKTEADYRRILEDPDVDAVHICTPNALHFPMAKDALRGRQARHLREAARDLRRRGAASWSSWRREDQAAATAPSTTCASTRWCSRCAACAKTANWARFWSCRAPIRRTGCSTTPIGTGASIRRRTALRAAWPISARTGATWPSTSPGSASPSLCADLQTFHKTRKRPKGPIETFAGKTLKPEDYIEVPIDTEDFGAVVFRMGDRARGAFTASQVSAGRKNRLCIEIFGTKAGVSWNQERPDELWIGQRNSQQPDHRQGSVAAEASARGRTPICPGGHSEGYDDTFKQVFRRFYDSIADPSATPEYPQFADGLRQLTILEAELKSNETRSWVDVPAFQAATA